MPNREQQLQRAVADYLSAVLPAGAWFTSIGHGWGRRSVGPGLQPGVPDILVIYRGQAIWLELKGPRGRVSTAQRVTFAELAAAGAPVRVCYSVDAVRGVLEHNGVPLRSHNLQGA